MVSRASLAVVLVACGRLGFEPAGNPIVDPDATNADASPDSNTTVLGNAGVTVRNTSGAPLASADVVVLDPAGSLRGRTTTNDAGEAIVDVAAGDTIVAVPSDSCNAFAFVGVEPDDELRIGGDAPAPIGNVSVKFTNVGGTHFIRACGGFASVSANNVQEATLAVFPPCTTYDVLVEANGYATLEDVTFVPGQLVTVPGNYAMEASSELSITEIPAGLTSMHVEVLNFDGVHKIDQSATDVLDPATQFQTSHSLAPVGDRGVLEVTLVHPDSAFAQRHAMARPTTGDSSAAIDPLPWIVGQPVFDLAERKMLWETTGPGTADGVLFELAWSDNCRFHVVSPADLGKVKLPVLPADLERADPTPGLTLAPRMVLFAGDASNRYKQLRGRVLEARRELFLQYRAIPAFDRLSLPLLRTSGIVVPP